MQSRTNALTVQLQCDGIFSKLIDQKLRIRCTAHCHTLQNLDIKTLLQNIVWTCHLEGACREPDNINGKSVIIVIYMSNLLGWSFKVKTIKLLNKISVKPLVKMKKCNYFKNLYRKYL